jgi:hypothetical protein
VRRQAAFERINKADTRSVGSALPPASTMHAFKTAQQYPMNMNAAADRQIPGRPISLDESLAPPESPDSIRRRFRNPDPTDSQLAPTVAQLMQPIELARR